MLFPDANIILRFLLGDHRDMHEAAMRVFEQAEQGEFVLYLDTLVLAECVHTLTGPAYRRDRADVARALAEVLLLEGVTCEDKDRLTEALTLFAERGINFVDAYLVCRSRDAGAGVVSVNGDLVRLGTAVHVPAYKDECKQI
ncbi:PIN domain-containing protein [Alicyclobacillus contaminans]|uniref:PIN domain-containing protein n=1 Tax=Alicyclobacillus contaminans TaxID=392016 RepID=UPI0006872BFB|nr:PIN domain-containing protein [Alicyclobacillus contaminans]